MLDYYRANGMISAYAVGGNGGSLAIKYLNYLKFPNFPKPVKKSIVTLYHNSQATYDAAKCNLDDFIKYDNLFNSAAGIYELDKSMKYLQAKLDSAIASIAEDKLVEISF